MCITFEIAVDPSLAATCPIGISAVQRSTLIVLVIEMMQETKSNKNRGKIGLADASASKMQRDKVAVG